MPKLISQKNFSNLIISGFSTSSTNQFVLHEFSKLSYRSAKYQIQTSEGTSYQSTEFLIIHNGTITYNTEYATVKNNQILSSFDSDVNGNLVRILATPTSNNLTQFKIIGTMIEI